MGSIGMEQSLPWVSTPLFESYGLSRAAGCRIFLKLENLQPSGSFKSRGIGNYILHRLSERSLTTPNAGTPAHFYCPSGGNAGLACVVAATTLKHHATIGVPMSCAPEMIARLYAAGATDVIQHGKSLQEAADHLRSHVLAQDPEGIFVPPFDHPDIWAGNGTVMDELAPQLKGEGPDAVVCSVGGGGLLCGVMEGLDRLGWDKTEVVAVETRGAESLHLSLREGKMVTLAGITSKATSLGCVRVAERCFEDAKRPNVRSVVLDDAEAAMGCIRLADEERIMVELACGVNVAMCYNGRLEKVLKRKLTRDSKVVIILCGGSNVNLEMLSGWRNDLEGTCNTDV